jgi:hypothetical protein
MAHESKAPVPDPDATDGEIVAFFLRDAAHAREELARKERAVADLARVFGLDDLRALFSNLYQQHRVICEWGPVLYGPVT